MILELATIDIKADQNAGFEAALTQAQEVLKQSKGYVSHEFKKCIEQPNRYILLITWETLEAHTVGFRESELFVQWRGLIGSFFENPPVVVHYRAI
ncbi:heme-degrading monooxygenase HmoA [Arcicella aurantiaca]|uniref:Heme-degrading monooxygenase HmoA n=1 Tax=Arcicella aurantiaca TaxID=591202 RepID=A0A316EFZ5_9BACT|nr:antibiotic biosynthesis monooxygenase [Arcicella aurantiaca]PWK29021.1 heme-degrading monooxygenase HmoA [Arcicella aurantiaca]